MNEQKNVRTALKLLRRHMGGWKPVGRMVRMEAETLKRVAWGARVVSASLTFRLARFAEVSIDDLLAGKYAPHGTCPNCGKAPDFSDEETAKDWPRSKMFNFVDLDANPQTSDM